jgi:hypothetical protein
VHTTQPDPIDAMTNDDLRLLAKAQRKAMQAMCPHVHGHDKRRIQAVDLWNAALNAHLFSKPGDVGPVGIILAAMEELTKGALEAEKAAELAKQRWEKTTATAGIRTMAGALTIDDAVLAVCEDPSLLYSSQLG